MRKLHGSVKLLRILLAIIMAAMLPFQAFAYQPSITTQTLPEAAVGTFYHVQLLAEGFGKRIVWSADGLPDGLEIDPVSGIIFGTARQSGTYEIAVTAQSGWRWWRPKTDSTLFRLYVAPQPAQEPADAASTTPSAPSQTGAAAAAPLSAPEPQNDAGILPASTNTVVEWRSAELKDNDGTVTDRIELELTFVGNPKIEEGDFWDFIKIEGEMAEIDPDFFVIDNRDGFFIYTLVITNISEAFESGQDIQINILDLSDRRIEVTPDTRSVTLHLAAPEPSDEEKVQLALDELRQTDLLGENTSSSNITDHLSLPLSSSVSGCVISWRSSEPDVISDSGAVVRPEYSGVEVTLTATVTCNEASADANFVFFVIAENENQPAPPPDPDPDPDPQPDPDPKPESQSSSQPESQPESPPSTSSKIFTKITPSKSKTSGSKSGTANADLPVQIRSNVGTDGALNHSSVLNDLRLALQNTTGNFAVVKAQNAPDVSPETLEALAAAAREQGMQAVLHADTMTQNGRVDARLYVKPESFAGITEPVKLGIATQGVRPEKIKSFFEKHFENEVSVISCEQQGSFGTKLQIAAKIKLPEDTGNLVFYSYNATTNTFSRIVTAYRIDANGYLRFATELAGDLVVSNGPLKKR